MLTKLLSPASVAVVGASPDASKLRGKLLQLLRLGRFGGRIFPVNPAHKEIQKLTAYPTIAALPEIPDLALIVVPGPGVPLALQEAAVAGVGAAIVYSSGVSLEAVRRGVGGRGLRFLGPSSEGLIARSHQLAATFAPAAETLLCSPPVPAGQRRIAFVSQSGGLGFALAGRAHSQQLNVNCVITTGAEGDLDCLDVIEQLLIEDPPGAIALIVEGLKHGARLGAVAALAADRNVPIVALKLGRSQAGRRAALSHTARLSGTDAAFEAAFERYGIVPVSDQEQLLSVLAGLTRCRWRRIRRAAIVTTSGGVGVWAADLCGAQGIEVPELSDEVRRDLDLWVPSFGSTQNPVDVTAQAVEGTGEGIVRTVERLVGSDELDAVIVNMGLSAPGRIAKLLPTLTGLRNDQDKPILFHSHIEPAKENIEALATAGRAVHGSLRGCALALSAIDRYAGFLEKRAAHPPANNRRSPPFLFASPAALDYATVCALLAAYDVPTPPAVLVRDASDAREAARALGGRVVLKIQSPDVAHKTEVGGVVLDVAADAAAQAYERVIANTARVLPAARIEGVLIQRMMPPGHEVVLGVLRDEDFGPLVMVGAGGIYVEALADVCFALAPIDLHEAHALVDRLKTSAILRGARGRPPADVDALAALIVRLSQLAIDQAGTVDQLDLNPVLVYPQGQGVVAVDALVSAHEPRSSATGSDN